MGGSGRPGADADRHPDGRRDGARGAVRRRGTVPDRDSTHARRRVPDDDREGGRHVTRTLALGVSRGVLELKQFVRTREYVVFTLLFPVVIVVIFGAVFHGKV